LGGWGSSLTTSPPPVSNIVLFFKVLVLILGSSSSDDVRGPSDTIKGSGVKTIAVGTDSSVPVNQLNIIATGGDAVITTTTIIKINIILQPVIDKINDGKCHDIIRISVIYLTNLSTILPSDY
jgi:hypothetical protein